MQTADICDFFVSSNIKKQANSQLPLNVRKLKVIWLQGALPSWPHNQGFCLFAYCSITTVSLVY